MKANIGITENETIIQNLRKLDLLFSEEYKVLGSSDFAPGLLKKHKKWLGLLVRI